MLKSISEHSHKLIKVHRRSTLTYSQLEKLFGGYIFVDEITNESSEYSGESNEDEINTIPLNSSLKIIPSENESKYLFHTLIKAWTWLFWFSI